MRALIVGGGIAGPVLGMFLRRAGFEAVICEARAGYAAGEGAFLGVAPNGMNVLAALDCDRAIARLGHVSRAFCFLNGEGKHIGSIDQHDDQARFGQPMLMVKRAALQQVLLEEAARRGVVLQFGARLCALEQRGERVVARMEDGSEQVGDVLIGCDGLRSRTRALAFPDAPAPAYEGLLDFGGFTHALAGDPLTPGWNTMVFGKRAFFGAFLTPERELWWFHNGAAARPLFELDEQARRTRLLDEHAGDPAWIRGVIARSERILGPWPLYVVRELPRWHRGRVCLIGDAAHATTPSAGQGASLALEDAMLLARALRDAGEPERAFELFEHARRGRVREIAAQARRNSGSKTNTGALAGWFRDRTLATFLKLGASAQRRAHAYRIEWTRTSDAPLNGGGRGRAGAERA